MLKVSNFLIKIKGEKFRVWTTSGSSWFNSGKQVQKGPELAVVYKVKSVQGGGGPKKVQSPVVLNIKEVIPYHLLKWLQRKQILRCLFAKHFELLENSKSLDFFALEAILFCSLLLDFEPCAKKLPILVFSLCPPLEHLSWLFIANVKSLLNKPVYITERFWS